MASDFHDLDVYKHAVAFADEVRVDVLRWQAFDRWSAGLQLVRAADSIGANIAEGAGRWHRADRRRFLFIARGSLYEAEHWLLRANARGLTDDDHADDLDRLGRMLNGLIRKLP